MMTSVSSGHFINLMNVKNYHILVMFQPEYFHGLANFWNNFKYQRYHSLYLHNIGHTK